jgi:DNA-binding transcriptional LysR family regulator
VLDLNDFYYFVQVVDRGGFTAAENVLRIPKSTLSNRVQQLEARLGVRLLNRTSRRFVMTDAGGEFYRYAIVMLQEAERAENAMRHRLTEPAGTVRFTAAVATMQFAMREMVADFLIKYPKVNVIAHATADLVDIVGDNYDVAVRSHLGPLPDSTLVQRTLAQAPWFLFAGASYLEASSAPKDLHDLAGHPSLYVMRAGAAPGGPPAWRLRHSNGGEDEFVMPLMPRLLSDDTVGLKQAAMAGLGIVALPGYMCRDELRSGALKRVLPDWLAGVSALTALVPYRQGLLPSIRAFVDHLAAEFPKVVLL